jgi:hypothetical protein
LIQKAWTAPESLDWSGQFWQGRSDSTIELTAEKGFSPLLAWHATAGQISAMIDTYLKAAHLRGAPPSRERIRIGRVVSETDSVLQAKADLRFGGLSHAAPRLMHLLAPGSDPGELTFDRLIEDGHKDFGTVDRVSSAITPR